MANEKRLIDANEAFETITDFSGQAETKSAYAAFWKSAKAIQRMPTVDAVEVVRCGECRFVDTDKCPMSGTPGRVSASDFCSYGEKRGDGNA